MIHLYSLPSSSWRSRSIQSLLLTSAFAWIIIVVIGHPPSYYHVCGFLFLFFEVFYMSELRTYQRPQMSLFQFVPPLMFVKQLRVWLYPHSLFQNILHPHGIACQRAAASRCNMICIKWPEAQWDHQEGKQKSPNKFVISFKDCFPSQRFPWKYLQS